MGTITETDREKRDRLLDLLESRVFDPVLKTSGGTCDSSEDAKTLDDLKAATFLEKKSMRNEVETAEELKERFFQDLESEEGRRMAGQLEGLGLPSMRTVKEEFSRICRELEV